MSTWGDGGRQISLSFFLPSSSSFSYSGGGVPFDPRSPPPFSPITHSWHPSDRNNCFMGRLHPPTHRRFSNSKGNGDAVEFPPLSTRWASRPEKPAKPVLTFAERKTCSIFFTRQGFYVRSIGVSPVTNLESPEAFFTRFTRHSFSNPCINFA